MSNFSNYGTAPLADQQLAEVAFGELKQIAHHERHRVLHVIGIEGSFLCGRQIESPEGAKLLEGTHVLEIPIGTDDTYAMVLPSGFPESGLGVGVERRKEA